MSVNQNTPYDEGFKAFEDDLAESDCPYKDKGSKARKEWIDGYWNGNAKYNEMVTSHLFGSR